MRSRNFFSHTSCCRVEQHLLVIKIIKTDELKATLLDKKNPECALFYFNKYIYYHTTTNLTTHWKTSFFLSANSNIAYGTHRIRRCQENFPIVAHANLEYFVHCKVINATFVVVVWRLSCLNI